jgi:hypothetical protein
MFWPIDFSYRIGLLFVVEAASISAIAVTGLLLYIVVRPCYLSKIGCLELETVPPFLG